MAKRLRARSEDSEEVIQRRLAGAAQEILDYRRYEYVLVNDDVDQASEQLKAIVEAERKTPGARSVDSLRRTNPAVAARVEQILATFAVKEV